MKTHNLDILKSKQTSAVLGLLILVAIVAIAPHAFAQANPAGVGQQGGIPLGGNYGITTQPSPDQGQALGWGVGMAAAGLATGVGMWSIAKRR